MHEEENQIWLMFYHILILDVSILLSAHVWNILQNEFIGIIESNFFSVKTSHSLYKMSLCIKSFSFQFSLYYITSNIF